MITDDYCNNCIEVTRKGWDNWSMYGYLFASKYRGSLYGAGVLNHAVWDYVIATMRPHTGVGAMVELNAKELANLFGDVTEDQVVASIEFHCGPDERSQSQEEKGARLVREGQFLYRVVNYEKYRKLRNEYERRESNRRSVAESRKRKELGEELVPKKKAGRKGGELVARGSGPLSGEMLNERSVNAGNGEVTMSEHMEDGTG